ncbi:MAG TPA: dicarboxylate/amino acid:cation symporter [Sphingopyxis sp.]|uniref:dicarboxylate/amino acid:cation symporter n=1 Tax=Sphingopyxis sp. TaxID=1908224 RepID=UPI002CEFF030|nr:dicarboxylate/amino acid:cation symporter [Sphingopyxis sp.]HWW57149.1 dicarboxylate/amino acid:cation symporter [Sphingopyxis sp.]
MNAAHTPAKPRPWWSHLYVQVLAAILGGVLLGHFWPEAGVKLQPLGKAFIDLVKMIIAPVIFLTVSTGIASVGEGKALGRLTAKTFAYFLFFSTLALIIGLIVANVIQPGAGMNIDPRTLDPGAVAKIAEYDAKAHDTSLVGFLLAIIPTTFVSALTSGSILQALFAAILFGVALSHTGAAGAQVLGMLEKLSSVFFYLVGMLMRLAPVGAFGAMAFTIGEYGVESLVNLGALIATFYLTSILFVVVVLGTMARLCGFSIFRLIAYLKAELLLVLGTSSSEAALPSLMEKLERAGCAKPVVGMVVPTGYSFNLDGTNIYMTLAALFVAQATGVDLSLGDQIALLLVAMVSSKGAAGVTGAGFITLAATLTAVPTVPVAGLALILGIDRFMSECRALTNFIGNALAAIVVAIWEKALDRDALDRALAGKPPRELAAPPIEQDMD